MTRVEAAFPATAYTVSYEMNRRVNVGTLVSVKRRRERDVCDGAVNVDALDSRET